MPGAAARRAGLPPLLPLHASATARRRLGRTRHCPCAPSRRRVRDARHADLSLRPADETYPPANLGAIAARALRRIGYRADMRVARPGRERAATQAGVVAWLADYPAPSDFLELWFACGATFNAGTVCDPALDPRMAHAEALQAADPIAADAAWSAIDHTAADAALWVLLVDPREIELVSPRVGNYQYNALLGFLADQAWVR